MIDRFDSPSADPRAALTADDLQAAAMRAAPMVARRGRGDVLGLGAGVLGALVLGGVTLVAMSNSRAETPQTAAVAAPAVVEAVIAEPPPPAPPSAVAAAAPTAAPPADPNQVDPNQSRAQAMIVDNSGPAATVSPAAAVGAAPGAPTGLNADEQFAYRVGAGAPTAARASALASPQWTVVQGAIIAAVLETALNSDTPGYARAIVSRDVRSFDGSRVLIPRGSRLIGQYRSGLSAGQSRAFVIWNRLVRPDGVSIQLASPAMDAEGASGLGGKVDRHFAQRYGAATLLSLVSGLTASGSSSAVVIGTGGVQSAAAEALKADSAIPPTIRVPLGTPIQVFVARDLDFSGL